MTESPIHTENFRSRRCSTNCQGRQVFQFTPKTFVPALLHQLSRTGSPIHTENYRSSAAPPTVKDRFSNSHRRLSHSNAAPPTVKDRSSNSYRRLSFQRCSTNCQGQVSSNSHRRLSLQRCSTNCQGQILRFTPKTFAPALLHQLSRTGSPIHTEDFRSSAAPPIVKDRFSNSHRRLSLQRCSTNCQGQVLQFTPKTFAPALLHQLSRTGSPIHTENFRSSAAPPTVKDRFSNSHRRLSFQRCSTNCQGRVLQFTPKTFVPALLHQLSRTGSPIHTEDFRSSAAPPTVKDRFSNSHRRLSLQRCSTNCQGQVLQFTPKTFAPALLHQLSRTRFSNSHRRLSLQRCSTNCQRQVLQFTPKTFVPALLHQLSRTGSPIHTENFRSSAAPPTVKDRISNSHRRLSFQRCSTNCQGQDLQFTPKTFVPALLHQLSRAGSPIHTEDFRSSAAPPTVKDRISNSHRRLSLQRCSTNCQGQVSNSHRRLRSTRCSTNCQGQVLQFTPKTFRSSAAPPTVKDKFSNSHRKLSFQRCSTHCQGQVLQFTPKTFAQALLHQLSRTGFPIHTEDFRSSAAPPTGKDGISNSHRRHSFQRCFTNCKGQVLQFTPKTFVPALLHQLSRTGFPIHTENFRSSAAPPTVKDRFQFTPKTSFQRCSTNCQGQVFQFTPKTFAPALLHQLSRTGSPIHTEDFRSSAAPPTPIHTEDIRSSAAPPTVKTGSPIHTEDFRSSAAPPTVKDRSPIHTENFRSSAAPPSRTGSPIHTEDFVPALLHQLSRTGSPIHTEDFRSSVAPPTVKDRFSNSHRRLSLQRCSTDCQGQVLQFTPKNFAPALLHRLSKSGSPIHTEDFRSSADPPTVKDRSSDPHRRLSFQRCSNNCPGQVLQFTPKTFAPALLHQLSRTSSPIHTEDFRSSAAPPTVKDAGSPIHTEDFRSSAAPPICQGQVLQFTPKTFAPALLHQLSRTGFPIHTKDFRSTAAPPTVKDGISNSHRTLSFQRCSTNCQGRDLQFTPKTFVPGLLQQLSRTGSPIHTEDFRSSAAPPTVKDRFSNSHRRLSFQRCSTNCQGQVLQFTPKTFVPALLHQLSKDRFSNSHRRLSFQRCSTNCQGQVLQFTPKTFAPALLHQLSRTSSPIHTENFRSSTAPPTVKDRFSNSHRRLSFQRCSTNCQRQVLQFTPKTFVPALLQRVAPPQVLQLSRTGLSFQRCSNNSNSHRRLSLQRCQRCTPKTFHQLSTADNCSPIHTEDFRSSAAPPTVKDDNSHRRLLQFTGSEDFRAAPVKDRLHQRLSFQRCSKLSRTGKTSLQRCSTIHTALLHQTFEDSSAAPQTVKERFSNSHRRLSLQGCSTNCQGQVGQFTPKNFVPALLHQLSRNCSQIYTEDFRSSAALHQLPLFRFSSAPALLHHLSRTSSPIHTENFLQRCSTYCQRQGPKTFVPALLHQLSNSPTVKDRQFAKTFALLHQLSRTCSPVHSTNCQQLSQVLQFQFTLLHQPKTFAPALLHNLSRTSQGQVLQYTPKTFAPALHHQLSRTGFSNSHRRLTVKDRFFNSRRRLSFQRCSTNCQGQVLQFTPKTFATTLLHQLSRTGSPKIRSSAAQDNLSFSNTLPKTFVPELPTVKDRVPQFTPKTFVPALLHQLSRTGSPIHAEDFVPALLHQLSRTGSPIHTEDFRSSAAPPTVEDRFSRFTPKTFVPTLLHQLSRTGSPIHTEDFRSSAAPPTVKDKISNSHRRLSFQRCSTNCQGQVSNSHRRLSFQRCSTNCQGQVLQFTPKTFAPALLHQLSRTGSYNSHRRLSLQRCSTNRQRQVLQFTPKTFVPALLHQLSKTGCSNSLQLLAIHTEDFRSTKGQVFQFTPKTSCSNSHLCSRPTDLVLKFTPKTFAPALLHQLPKTGSPIHTEDFRSSAAPPPVKDKFSNSQLFRSSAAANCQGQGSPIHTENFRSSAAPFTVKDKILQFTPKTFVQQR